MAIKTIYHFTALTGGAATALDSVDGNSLLDGDVGFVMAGVVFYAYLLDASSGAAEDSPAVVSPDTNAGTKRWVLQNAPASTNGQDTGTAAPTTGTWTRGWIRWNTTPVAGENVGWICITAGTPGVWQPFGLISV